MQERQQEPQPKQPDEQPGGQKAKARLFYVDTKFQQLARKPGGRSRDQALQLAQHNIDEMKTDIVDWLLTNTKRLADLLNRAEPNAINAIDLKTAIEQCSQLRDVGGTVGYLLLSIVAHSLCEVLEATKAGARFDKRTAICHTNALYLSTTKPYNTATPDEVPDMISGLKRITMIATRGVV